jgi:hypothetical protein
MENYEEMLLQITDVLKAHNRYHMKTPDHKQAIEQIRAIVAPKGKWVEHSTYKDVLICSNCNHGSNQVYDTFNFCPNCGAMMIKEDPENVSR